MYFAFAFVSPPPHPHPRALARALLVYIPEHVRLYWNFGALEYAYPARLGVCAARSILENVAPYVTSLSGIASNKLLLMFERFATPKFIFARREVRARAWGYVM